MTWAEASYADALSAFPTLRLHPDGGLAGLLPFKAALKGKSLLLDPGAEDLADPDIQVTFIVDRYEVVVREKDGKPQLQVPGDRVPRVAKSRAKRLIDLHLYSDHSACYTATQDLEQQVEVGISPRNFIERYAIPFLYSQAYFERFNEWPFGELAHGPVGLIQWLGDLKDPSDSDVRRTLISLSRKDWKPLVFLARRARWHRPCPCGSGKKLRHCHPSFKLGADFIRGRVSRGAFPVYRRMLALISYALDEIDAGQGHGR